MRRYTSALYEREMLWPNSRWATVVLVPLVVCVLALSAIAVARSPSLVAGVAIGLSVRALRRADRGAARHLSARSHSAITTSISGSLARRLPVTEVP